MGCMCKRLVCFEPMPIRERLVRNLQLNGIEDCEVYSFIIGCENRNAVETSFEYEWHKSGKANDAAVSLPMRTLYDAIAGPVDFLKIDVDGFELEVVLGGLRTLTEYRPVVVQEFAKVRNAFAEGAWNKTRDQDEWKSRWRLLADIYANLGYVPRDTSAGKAKTAAELQGVLEAVSARKASSVDVLFVHPGRATLPA
jgi:FkbM family methyltransferase